MATGKQPNRTDLDQRPSSLVPGFQNRPLFRPCGGGMKWVLEQDLRYIGPDGETITVLAPFITDFASARFGYWNLLSRPAMYSLSSVLHDWCYTQPSISRKEADRLFLQAMELENIAYWDRTLAYFAVRLFGKSSYLARKIHRS